MAGRAGRTSISQSLTNETMDGLKATLGDLAVKIGAAFTRLHYRISHYQDIPNTRTLFKGFTKH